MRNPGLALIWTSIWFSTLGLACVDPSPSSNSDETEGDGDGECVPPDVVQPTPTPIDPLCLVDTPCVEDANCPSGYVCNGALAPSACSKIFCGVVGTPCSAAAACLSDLQCDGNGVCNPCDVCGDQCSVDFQTDPAHCGCCDNPVPDSGTCVGGEPGCAAGMASCDGVCIDVTADPDNCGDCGVVVGADAQCIDGEVVCDSASATQCGSECVSTATSNEHCGGCDQACPEASDGCDEGKCASVVTELGSCTDACAAIGMSCSDSGDHVAYYAGNGEDEFLPIDGCDVVPPENNNCDGVSCQFVNLRCFCSF